MNQCFPQSSISNWKMLFHVCEAVCVIVLTLIGIELRMKGLLFEQIWSDPSSAFETSIAFLDSKEFLKQPEILNRMLTDCPFYAYTRFSSLILAIIGYKTSVLYWINIVFSVFASFLAYRLSRHYAGRFSGVITYAVLMIMPSQIYTVSVAGSFFFISGWVLFELLFYKYSTELDSRQISTPVAALLYCICGVLMAFSVFVCPASVFILLFEILDLIFLQKREYPHPIRQGMIKSIVLILFFAAALTGLYMAKGKDLGVSYLSVVEG